MYKYVVIKSTTFGKYGYLKVGQIILSDKKMSESVKLGLVAPVLPGPVILHKPKPMLKHKLPKLPLRRKLVTGRYFI